MSHFEVWCHSCDVSFPLGTKQCLHCGVRTAPGPPRASSPGSEEFEFMASAMTFDEPSAASRAAQLASLPDLPTDAAGEVAPSRRSALRAGMTVLWMVLLAAGYAWRACSQ